MARRKLFLRSFGRKGALLFGLLIAAALAFHLLAMPARLFANLLATLRLDWTLGFAGSLGMGPASVQRGLAVVFGLLAGAMTAVVMRWLDRSEGHAAETAIPEPVHAVAEFGAPEGALAKAGATWAEEKAAEGGEGPLAMEPHPADRAGDGAAPEPGDWPRFRRLASDEPLANAAASNLPAPPDPPAHPIPVVRIDDEADGADAMPPFRSASEQGTPDPVEEGRGADADDFVSIAELMQRLRRNLVLADAAAESWSDAYREEDEADPDDVPGPQPVGPGVQSALDELRALARRE